MGSGHEAGNSKSLDDGSSKPCRGHREAPTPDLTRHPSACEEDGAADQSGSSLGPAGKQHFLPTVTSREGAAISNIERGTRSGIPEFYRKQPLLNASGCWVSRQRCGGI
jgi:hypothetical protein